MHDRVLYLSIHAHAWLPAHACMRACMHDTYDDDGPYCNLSCPKSHAMLRWHAAAASMRK